MEFENSRQQGAYGVGQAISYFLSEGYHVSLPIADTQRYDLIADNDGDISRVEVKCSSYRVDDVSFQVQLATSGGNQSWHGVPKLISPEDCDIVFVHTMDGKSYLFPSELLSDRKTISVGRKWVEFQVRGEVYEKPLGVARQRESKPRPTKIEWPGRQELLDMVAALGYTGTARKLSTETTSVSDNAVRKRIVSTGL